MNKTLNALRRRETIHTRCVLVRICRNAKTVSFVLAGMEVTQMSEIRLKTLPVLRGARHITERLRT